MNNSERSFKITDPNWLTSEVKADISAKII